MTARAEEVPKTAEGWRTCVLCGHGGMLSVVRPWIGRLAQPGPHGAFVPVIRCVDHAACRSRCEANGDPWPIADATPAAAHTPDMPNPGPDPDEWSFDR